MSFIQKLHVIALGLWFPIRFLEVSIVLGAFRVVGLLVLCSCLVHRLQEKGFLHFLHFLHHCPLESCVSREILRVRTTSLAFLHPGMTPDFPKCRPLSEIVSHHPEHQIFEFIRVLVHPKRQIHFIGKVKP